MAFEECEYEWSTSYSEELLSPVFPIGKALFKWQLQIKSEKLDLLLSEAPVGAIKVLCRFSVDEKTHVISHQLTNLSLSGLVSSVTILSDKDDLQSLKTREHFSFKLCIWALALSTITLGNFNSTSHECLAMSLLHSISKNSDFWDLIIKVGSTEYNVHKNILTAVSPVFRAALVNDSKEKNSNCIEISNFEKDTVQKMIDFIYGRSIFIFDVQIGAELLRIADMYDIKLLKNYCIEHFTKHFMKEENISQVILLADMNNAPELKENAINYFVNNKTVCSPIELQEIARHRPFVLTELVAKLLEKNSLKKFITDMPYEQSRANCFTKHNVVTPDYNTLVQFLKDSNTYGIVNLKSFCINHLKKMINDSNVLSMIILADINNAPILKIFAIDYFINSNKVYSKSEFEEIESQRPSLFPELLAKMSEKCSGNGFFKL